MMCPVEIASDLSALRGARVGDHAKHGFLLEGHDGAGHENTGSDFAGAGEEDHLVAGGRIRRSWCFVPFPCRGLKARRGPVESLPPAGPSPYQGRWRFRIDRNMVPRRPDITVPYRAEHSPSGVVLSFAYT